MNTYVYIYSSSDDCIYRNRDEYMYSSSDEHICIHI
jgi:hypothetical protein